MPIQYFFREARFASRILSLILLLALGTVISCSEDPPQAPPVEENPSDTIANVIRITFPRAPLEIDAIDPFALQWEAQGEGTKDIRIMYHAVGKKEWTFLDLVSRPLMGKEISLHEFSDGPYRFAISACNERLWDSSAVVSIRRRPVHLLEPRDGEVLLAGEPIRFRWHPVPAGNGMVEIQSSAWLAEKWTNSWRRTGSDSVFILENPPYASGRCADFRIRDENSSTWTYVRGVGFGNLAITSPRAGETFYRFLQTTVETDMKLPGCMTPQGETRYDVSTDGGANWEKVDREWKIVQKATKQAFLRVRNDDLGHERAVGPFTIMDRSAPYFTIGIGDKFRYYVFTYVEHPGVTDTSSRAWLTITVLGAADNTQRLEYSCSLLYEDSDGTQHTSTGLLWRDHDAQEMVGGDFEPFKNAAVFGLHDISIDSWEQITQHTPQGQIPASFTSYKSVRGKGLTQKNVWTVTGRIVPEAKGICYLLLK